MGRKPRIEYRGATYHIIQRGNNREYIFRDINSKKYVLEITREYKTSMNFFIYGYVLMDNHYHMIIKTIDVPLQKIMHRINNRYSKYYNSVNGRTGHVFQNRYKAILVKDDKYLLSLLRYIHQNPVKAQICRNIREYIWSSDSAYRKNIQNHLTDINFILNMFSSNRKKALQLYHNFMENEELEDELIFEETDIIGQTEQNLIHKQNDHLIKENLNSILLSVVCNREIFENIKSGSRKRHLMPYKKAYIKKGLILNYTMKEIAENISISESAVFKLHNKI